MIYPMGKRKKGDYSLSWRDIKIDHIDYVEKCVAEFEITALRFFKKVYEGDTIHYGAFKVKVYQNQNIQLRPYESTEFTGVTNLRLKDSMGLGGYEGGIGFGDTVEQALEDTVRNFFGNVMERKAMKKMGLCKEDFVLIDYDEF